MQEGHITSLTLSATPGGKKYKFPGQGYPGSMLPASGLAESQQEHCPPPRRCSSLCGYSLPASNVLLLLC